MQQQKDQQQHDWCNQHQTGLGRLQILEVATPADFVSRGQRNLLFDCGFSVSDK